MTLNKQGPSSLVHSGGVLGGSPQVTTAFFKAAAPTELFEISTPGGAYHPLQPVPECKEQSGHLTFITVHQKSIEKNTGYYMGTLRYEISHLTN